MPIIKDTLTNPSGESVTIYIEVDHSQDSISSSPYSDVRGKGKEVIEAAKDVFGSGMSLLRTCAEQVVHTIEQVEEKVRPTEFEVQFSIKLDSEVGAVLAKASAEAQLQVTMKWVQKEVV